jgi:hypothetical protein
MERSIEAIKPVVEGLETRTMLAAGLTGHYFNNRSLRGEATLVRDDATAINFAFGNNAPAGMPAGFPIDNYSIGWEGTFTPPETATYSFFTRSDDGMRLWVNGQLITDRWIDRGAPALPGDAPLRTLTLDAGVPVPIVAHYYEHTGGASSELRFSNTATVTTARLFNAGELNTPTTAPTAPTNLTLTGTPNAFGANFTFTDNAISELRYKLQVLDPGSTTWRTVANTTPNMSATAGDTLSIAAVSLLPSTTYKVRVVAASAAGDSPSNEVDLTTSGATNGIIGEYFEDNATTGAANAAGNFRGDGLLAFVRVEDGNQLDAASPKTGAVDLNWGDANAVPPPTFFNPMLPVEDFSTRYQGKITITTAGTYRFYTESDDGSHLFVNGQLVSNNGGAHGAIMVQAVPIDLQPGTYPVVGYFAERGGGALSRIRWAPPGVDYNNAALRAVIPANVLVPVVDPLAGPTTGLAASNITHNTLTLTWTDANLNDARNVVQRSTDGVNWTNIGFLMATGSSASGASGTGTFNVTGLTPNTAYQFRIVTENFVDSETSTPLAASTNPLPTGTTTSTSTPVTGDVNLTTEGTLDWAHWGDLDVPGGYEHKYVTTGVRLGDWTLLGTGATAQAFDLPVGTFSYTDGTPDFTFPGDTVAIVNGQNDGDADAGAPPAAEGFANAIDNTTNKYLNFLDLNSGFTVIPNFGPTVVTGIKLYTANDTEGRDPDSYKLEGSNDGTNWTVVNEQSALALPAGRNPTGLPLSAAQFSKTFNFANSTAWLRYRVTFPTLKNAGGVNSMQIGEVELLTNRTQAAATPDAVATAGVNNGFRVQVPATNKNRRRVNIYVGVEDGVTGRLTASQLDGSAAPVVQDLVSAPGEGFKLVKYSFDYKSGLDNQTFRIDWVNQSATGRIVLAAATLEEIDTPAAATVTATPTGKGRVAVTWLDNAGNETGYRVERTGDIAGAPDDASWTGIANLGPNSTFFVDTGQPDGTRLWYRVVALNPQLGNSISTPDDATTITTFAAGLKGSYRTNIPAGPDPGTGPATLIRLDNGTQAFGNAGGPVAFNWGNNAPDPAITPNNFSVVWEGRIIPDFTERYTFETDTDDRVRLYLDYNDNGTFEQNEMIIDFWIDQGTGTRESSEQITPGGFLLNAGQDYNIKMEFYENGGGAAAQLFWRGPRQPNQFIPVTSTLPPPVPAPTGQVQDLTATALNSGRARVAWTYNGPELVGPDLQFILERALDNPANPGTPGTFTNIGLVGATQYVDGTAPANTKVYYRVTPVTFGGTGTTAGPVSATTVVGPFGTGTHVTFFDAPALNNPPPGTGPSKNPIPGPVWHNADTVDEHPNINFFWGANPPTGAGAGFGGDQFLVQWTATIKPEFSETYTFFTEVDDGYRVNVGGTSLFNQLDTRQGMTLSAPATIDLVAGQEYSLSFAMVEDGGDAGARLYWQSPSLPREIVPTVVLRPALPDLIPPAITDIAVDGHLPAGVPYSPAFHLNIKFSEAVTGVDEFDFILITPLGNFNADVLDVVYDPASQTAVLTVPGLFDPPQRLPDGNYSLQIVPTNGIADSAGNSLDGDGDGQPGGTRDIPFYVLQGDTQKAFDGTALKDRVVSFVDYQIMSRNFGMANPSHSDGDFNYDGVIDNADFLYLFGTSGTPGRMGTKLDPPQPAAPVASTPAPTPVPVTTVPPPTPVKTPVKTPAPVKKPAPAPVKKAAPPVVVKAPAPRKFATRKISDLLA